MAFQKNEPGADFWFVMERRCGKVKELAGDAHLNLGLLQARTREWVSVSAQRAVSTADRSSSGSSGAPDWKAVVRGQGAAPTDGSAEDPRLLLIGVAARVGAHSLSGGEAADVVLFELLQGMITGKKPDLGRIRQASGAAMRKKRTSGKGTARKAGGRKKGAKKR